MSKIGFGFDGKEEKEGIKINYDEVRNCFLTVIFFIISFFVLSAILSLNETNFRDSLTFR